MYVSELERGLGGALGVDIVTPRHLFYSILLLLFGLLEVTNAVYTALFFFTLFLSSGSYL